MPPTPTTLSGTLCGSCLFYQVIISHATEPSASSRWIIGGVGHDEHADLAACSGIATDANCTVACLAAEPLWWSNGWLQPVSGTCSGFLKLGCSNGLLRCLLALNARSQLVTGGVGYIGSHTVLELLEAGYNVVIVDNLCNSNLECLRRVEQLAGREAVFYKVDIRDKEALSAVFRDHEIGAVIHFAGLKAVGESVAKPMLYYQVNIEGTLNLAQVMSDAGCFNIVFSSSATV